MIFIVVTMNVVFDYVCDNYDAYDDYDDDDYCYYYDYDDADCFSSPYPWVFMHVTSFCLMLSICWIQR